MSTIKDVAKRARVSIATVSHVINNTRFVSERTRTRVVRAMEELGYRPDRLARGLRKKTTHTIGLVISDILNPFYPAIVRGVEDVAVKCGYNLILCNSDETLSKEKEYVEVLYEKRVDGLIITPTFGGQHDHLSLLIDKGIPVVCVDREANDISTDCVLVDNFKGAYEAVSYILSRGHRKVAIISLPYTLTSGKERFNGYMKALQEQGLTVSPDSVVEAATTEESGYAGACKLLDSLSPPFALFATNNLLALGALKAIKERGLKIPKDIAMLCFDDMPWAEVTDPPLTAVAQPTYEIGKVAASLVMERLQKKGPWEPKTIMLEPKLIIRTSI